MRLFDFLLQSGLNQAEAAAYINFMKIISEPVEEMETLFRLPPEQLEKVLSGLLRKGLIRKIPCDGTVEYGALAWEQQHWFTARRLAGINREFAEYGKRTLQRMLDYRCQPVMTVVAPREAPELLLRNTPQAHFVNHRFPALDLRLGTICNLRCRYCLLGTEHRTDSLSGRDVLDTYRRALSLNIEKLVLTGGEPTVRNDLIGLIKMARTMGFRLINLNTNAVLLKDRAAAAKIMEAGVDAVGFSFDTTDEKLADHLYRRAGAGAALLSAVDTLFSLFGAMSCITVVNKLNYEKLNEIVDFFAKKLSLFSTDFFLTFDFISPESGAWVNRGELIPRMSEAAPFLRNALLRGEKLGLNLAFRNIPLCLMPGMDRFCLDSYMNIYQLVLRDGGSYEFNATHHEYIFRFGAGCHECAHYRQCLGFSSAYADIYGDSEFIPVKKERAV